METQKHPKILLTSTQSPGNGGAATNLYKLNKYLLEKGLSVYCIFFLCNKENPTNIKADPEKLGNVHCIECFWKTGELMKYNAKTNKYAAYSPCAIAAQRQKITNHLGGTPDSIFAKNYLAPITSRILFPKAKVYYLVSGVYYMSLLNNNSPTPISAQKVLSDIKHYTALVDTHRTSTSYTNILQEKQTIKMVDGIVYNSLLTKQLVESYYESCRHKLSWVINTSFIPENKKELCCFESRRYDILYVCSNFQRKIKNSELVNRILASSKLSQYKKIVIGDNSSFNPSIPNIEVRKQQPHTEILECMRLSKVLLIPSLFDSSPNVLYEAIDCGCNVVLSRNVGNHGLFNNDMVCSDIYDVDEWIDKVLNGIRTRIPPFKGNNERDADICKSLLSIIE